MQVILFTAVSNVRLYRPTLKVNWNGIHLTSFFNLFGVLKQRSLAVQCANYSRPEHQLAQGQHIHVHIHVYVCITASIPTVVSTAPAGSIATAVFLSYLAVGLEHGQYKQTINYRLLIHFDKHNYKQFEGRGQRILSYCLYICTCTTATQVHLSLHILHTIYGPSCKNY